MNPRVFIVVLVAATAGSGCFRVPHPVPDAPRAPATAALLDLMNERLKLMPGVAKAKWNSHASIEDPEREAALVKAMADAGAAHGLDPAATTVFFAAQIEAAKLLQHEAFRGWLTVSQGVHADAPDLKRDVRPQIDAIGQKLLRALAAARTERPPPELVKALAGHHLSAPGVSDTVREAAIRPLIAGPP